MSEKIKRKILVVDDDITVCKSITASIQCEEYEVDSALSGEEALSKDREKPYDLVITDLMMPGISGLDLLQSLKAERPAVNVIMVTGYPTIKTAVQSVKLGAFDYIPKPFTPVELRSLVARVFKKVETEEMEAEEKMAPGMPPGLHYMIGHTWLKIEPQGMAAVGVVYDFLKTVGIIVELELPRMDTIVSQGEICGKITDAEKFVHRIWSPASGRVIEVNEKLKEDPSLLRQDPYGEGWLFKIEPTNLEEDLKGLVLSK